MEFARKPGRVALVVALAVTPLSAAISVCAQAQDARQYEAVPKGLLTVAAMLTAEPEVETALDIRVGPESLLPKQSFIRVRGLPLSAKLTEGHVITPGSWAVPINALGTLKLLAPVSASGRTDITVTLLTIDGAALAETKSALVVAPAWLFGSAAGRGKDADGSGAPRAAGTVVASLTPAPLASAIAPSGAGIAAAPPLPAPPITMPAALPPAPTVSAALPPQRAATPVQSAPPSAADAARAEQLVVQGDIWRAQGNVAAARQFYRRSADLGSSTGAMHLAATYDSAELAQMQVRGIQGDPAEARKWYERARELGAAEAVSRLSRLGSR